MSRRVSRDRAVRQARCRSLRLTRAQRRRACCSRGRRGDRSLRPRRQGMPRRPAQSCASRDAGSSALRTDRRAARSRLLREWVLLLPSDPLFAARPALLFPDRNGLFKAIDDVAAGVECFAAMGRGAGDGDRGLADLQQTEAMNDCDVDLLKTYINITNYF